MNVKSDHTCHHGSKKNRPLIVIISLIFAVGGAYYLWLHQAHLYQYLPVLVLLLCPLMHLFGGHGGHGQHDHPKDT